MSGTAGYMVLGLMSGDDHFRPMEWCVGEDLEGFYFSDTPTLFKRRASAVYRMEKEIARRRDGWPELQLSVVRVLNGNE